MPSNAGLVWVRLYVTAFHKGIFKAVRCMEPTWPYNQIKHKLAQFPVCPNVSVLSNLEILPQACEKHIH